MYMLCVIFVMFSVFSAVGLLLMLVSLPNVCCAVCHVLLLLGRGGADEYCLFQSGWRCVCLLFPMHISGRHGGRRGGHDCCLLLPLNLSG